MAEADWTFLANGAAAASIDRGITSGIDKPAGGGSFAFGFNSLVSNEGAVGLYVDLVDFNPMAKGGSIRGAIKRSTSAGPTGFSPFFFIGGQGTDIDDSAYLFGLEDDDPHQIVIRKGAISGGIPDDDPGTGGILAKSTAEYSANTWLHVRLDMIVNGNGDVILQAFENDLDTNDVDSPVWTAIPGLEEFIDDTLGINSGTAPFTSGYGGFGFRSANISRRGFVDHIELLRQT